MITLFDRKPELCEAWRKEFADCPEVSVLECYTLDHVPYHDFLVTAGNSFGAMSGGIDLAVRGMMGYAFQDKLQLSIMYSTPLGLAVGEYMIIPSTRPKQFGHVVYAPTMRTPSLARKLDIAYVSSVIFDLTSEYPDKTFAIPGLGTGCGTLNPVEAARMMKAGYLTAKEA